MGARLPSRLVVFKPREQHARRPAGGEGDRERATFRRVSWQTRYLDRFYAERPGWVDGTTQFHELCRRHVPSPARLLEIGAGPTNRTSDFLATLGELDGVDIDPDVTTNRALKTAHTIRGDSYPYADATFDACVSNYVAEHVENPPAHLAEVHRVLKRRGVYVLRTPNLFHYVSLVSWLTPHWFHTAVANRLRDRTGAHEPYPTKYLMNTRTSLSALARAAGFEVSSLDLVEKEPSYGLYARPLFIAFMGYERLVNSHELAAPLRSNLFVALRKV
jgi:SAM-dependent methyltransferase